MFNHYTKVKFLREKIKFLFNISPTMVPLSLN